MRLLTRHQEQGELISADAVAVAGGPDQQLASRLDRLILLIVLHFGYRGGNAQRIEHAFQLARNIALLGDSNSLSLILEFVFRFVETEKGIAGLAGTTILTARIN